MSSGNLLEGGGGLSAELVRSDPSSRDRTVILGALMVVFLLGAVDETIVNTALPRIISELHGLSNYAWVSTAYMLTIAVAVPIFGKLGDMIGRRSILLGGIGLFLLGSMLCGMSGESFLGSLLGGGMTQLIVFRAIQGLGAGALCTTAFSTLGDLFAPRERGRYMGLFGGMFGLALVIGPTLGGFLTDHGSTTLLSHPIEGWRWVFYVNLPLGSLSLFVLHWLLPRVAVPAHGPFDVAGAVLVVVFTVPLMLALTWGGNTYPWNSRIILGLLAGSLVGLLALIQVEARNPDAVVPVRLFLNREFALVNLVGFLTGMSFFGVMLFLPLFMQLVQGVSATSSGFSLQPLVGGMLLASIVGGLVASRSGRYQPTLILAQLLLLAGVLALSRIDVNTTPIDLAWRMVLVGLGIGPSQSLGNIAVQNAVPDELNGIATSCSLFFRQIGATVGLALFGAVLSHHLMIALPGAMPPLPGIEPQRFALSELRVDGNLEGMRDSLVKGLAMPRQVLERAIAGDAIAKRAILGYAGTPAKLRELLERGLPPATHVGLVRKLDRVLMIYASEMASDIERGLKVAFSAALARMLELNVPITLLGFLVILFLPRTPLRDGRAPALGEAATSRPGVEAGGTGS